MKHYILPTLIALIAFKANSQSLFNNWGAGIYMMPGSYMIVNNDSLYNHLGTIQNAGDLRVAGDIFNDDTLTGGPGLATGLYDIGGNWVNSGTVISYQDSVLLNGNALGSSGPAGTQYITGSSVTPFYNLILAGTPGSSKYQTIDASVSGILDLRDHELATQSNEMLVLNTNPSAITKYSGDSGYVSSITTGRLTRATNAVVPYFYPTGTPSDSVSSSYPFYYRPINMTPASAAANRYGVRLVDNTSADGFNVQDLDSVLCSVNPLYYHRLYHSTGSDPADITMYFDAATDGGWTDMAHWQTGSPWTYMGSPVYGSAYGFTSLQIRNWSNYSPFPFALASKKFTVNAGQDQIVNPGETVSLQVTVSTPSIASIEWTPDVYLNNNTIADPSSTPAQTTEYFVTVTNSSGCVVKDSVTLTVLPDLLLIPTAFSPNKDGRNDIFKPLNKNLKKIEFQVYDRWGQKIYETDVIGDGWDGTYKNVNQDIGVYVWQARYQLDGSSEMLSASGNVTLIR